MSFLVTPHSLVTCNIKSMVLLFVYFVSAAKTWNSMVGFIILGSSHNAWKQSHHHMLWFSQCFTSWTGTVCLTGIWLTESVTWCNDNLHLWYTMAPVLSLSVDAGMRSCTKGNTKKANKSNVTETARPIRAQGLSLVSRKWKMRWTHAPTSVSVSVNSSWSITYNLAKKRWTGQKETE